MSKIDFTFKELMGRTLVEEMFEEFVDRTFPTVEVGDFIEVN